MEIILDNIAIWKPKLGDGLTVRKMPVGTRIQKPGSNILAPSNQPIFRYAKNYTISEESKIHYCLFVRTYLDDKQGIEAVLDAYAETLSATDVASAIAGSDDKHFTYTNKYLENK